MLVSLLLLVSLVSLGAEAIKIGLLIPKDVQVVDGGEANWQFCAAAATLAVDDLKESGHLNGSVEVQIVWRDDKAAESFGYWGAHELVYAENCDVIIGSPYATATHSSALLTAFVNLPQICWKCTSTDLNDKRVYRTLVRVFAHYGKMSAILLKILQFFNWKVAALWMADDADWCKFIRPALLNSFRDNNITIFQDISFPNRSFSLSFVQKSLEQVKLGARIIIPCGPIEFVRPFVLEAYKQGMTGHTGYLFWFPFLNLGPSYRGWIANDSDNDMAKEAWKSVFEIGVHISTPEMIALRNRIPLQMTLPPFNDSTALRSNSSGGAAAPYLYDAVFLYGLYLNYSFQRGLDARDGNSFFNFIKNKTFKGVTGDLVFDEFADRDDNFSVYSVDVAGTAYTEVMTVMSSKFFTPEQSIQFLQQIRWQTHNGKAPPDRPVCGFFDELCPSEQNASTVQLAVGIVIVGMILLAGMLALYREIAARKARQQLLWRIDSSELTVDNTQAEICLLSMKSLQATQDDDDKRTSKRVATFRGNLVHVETLELANGVPFGKREEAMLTTMRSLNHDNVNAFIGAAVAPGKLYFVTSFCARGSLKDILENEEIHLDTAFKGGFLSDLVEGIVYLHGSPLKCAGNLSSASCVVDRRWAVKITDYGMDHVRSGVRRSSDDSDQIYRKLLWTAPEHLPLVTPSSLLVYPPEKSQAGDVYSFAIIVYEVLFRIPPFSGNRHPAILTRDVIDRVRNREFIPFRPELPQRCSGTADELVGLMTHCWNDTAAGRPTARSARRTLRGILGGRKANSTDRVLTKLEKYATNLEEIVKDRNGQLIGEKKKTDMLLYRMLPASVAEHLKQGNAIQPERFEEVTVYFSDMVGFTSLSAQATPLQVVQLLNDLYTLFDDIISRHEVYKVDTSGDALMVVSGLPLRNGRQHAAEIANMALDMLSAVMFIRVEHAPDVQLRIRIGLHTGPVVAGVIGHTMPRYCLFGDTVSTASRMESTGVPLRIQLSESTFAILNGFRIYLMQPRGDAEVQGKGKGRTFFLYGREGYKKPLPDPSESTEGTCT